MKNTLLKKVGIVTIILLAFVASQSFTSNEKQFDNTLNAIADIAIASGESGGGVSCYCGQVYGRGCKADNRGARCNPEGSSKCWEYDRNCN